MRAEPRSQAKSNEPHSEVLVIGAGPTGLVLALWLARRGIHVRIIDKAPGVGTTSRALAVQVRTLEFYRQLGFAASLIEGGVRIAGLNLWVRGDKAARIPLEGVGRGLTPYPFVLVFPQDAHERVLIAQLAHEGVTVERGTELIGLEQHDDGVRASLSLPDGSTETVLTPWLAGCDGASSTVRERLGTGFPGGTYTGLFYVADVEAAGPATNHELHVDLENADFLAVFPLKSSGHVRLVGPLRDRSDRAVDTLTFEDVRERAIRRLKLEVGRVNWFSTYRVHHRVAARFRNRRVFLLGDAAHIHSPVGGQGMNTGIGDAVNLAWKLAAVLKHEASEELLDTYEPERIAFARRLVATTDRLFALVTARGRIARITRTRVVPLLAPPLVRLGLGRCAFKTASQIGIRYPASPLSAGRAGRIRGGDRLPWVETSQGANNFEPLRSLDWQVHVYGEAPPHLASKCAGLALPMHAFPWRPEVRREGLARHAVYLVRPDGYVALADPDGDPARLAEYIERWGIRFGAE